MTGLIFNVAASSRTTTYIATIGYIAAGTWTGTGATCTITTRNTQCIFSGSVSIPAGDQINIQAAIASGSASSAGNWTVTYTLP